MTRVTSGNNGITQKYKKTLGIITHGGIDIGWHSKESDNTILAHTSGKVIYVKNDYATTDTTGSSYGNYIIIDHQNGYWTLYAHLKKGTAKVKVGDAVKTGQEIAVMGNTGRSSGRHCHFEVRAGANNTKSRIDPEPYLNADLPTPAKEYTYLAYDNKKKKWLPSVSTAKANDYAGNKGNSIGGIKVSELTYRVHDKTKNKWLPEVTGLGNYAGNIGNEIDKVAIKGNVKYRVHTKGGSWLGWVDGYNTKDSKNGYAGLTGKTIDLIQINKK